MVRKKIVEEFYEEIEEQDKVDTVDGRGKTIGKNKPEEEECYGFALREDKTVIKHIKKTGEVYYTVNGIRVEMFK